MIEAAVVGTPKQEKKQTDDLNQPCGWLCREYAVAVLAYAYGPLQLVAFTATLELSAILITTVTLAWHSTNRSCSALLVSCSAKSRRDMSEMFRIARQQSSSHFQDHGGKIPPSTTPKICSYTDSTQRYVSDGQTWLIKNIREDRVSFPGFFFSLNFCGLSFWSKLDWINVGKWMIAAFATFCSNLLLLTSTSRTLCFSRNSPHRGLV